ncbi:hypothetical protein [Herpetosiphon sp.]|uniref:Uncharacterized protein n=1 Tax=Herpetosiphon aurantiacus (strain ATCC 23779 / DSM 785 / 114-95) TaxID=316274 RepID=A9AYN6_HERA2|nr:hypothetical protein [Herpetosiphon sp.]ABX05014.1 hypothetical protein Haur_2374 [Herpetosiphon aurantiacus DSM 785]
MEHVSHTAVMNWLAQLSNATAGLLSPPTLYWHIATCKQCRAHLTLLTITSPALSPPSEPALCQLDFEAIAAFIEAEAELGTYQALQQHSAIWWHLSSCRACAELYATTVADLSLAPKNAVDFKPIGLELRLPSFTPIPRYQKLWPELTIAAGQLTALMHYQQARFRAAEGDEEPSVIHEASGPDLTIEASLVLQEGIWRIRLTVDPPITGRAVAAIGDQHFYATFEHGVATFDGFNAALFDADPSVSMRVFAEQSLE